MKSLWNKVWKVFIIIGSVLGAAILFFKKKPGEFADDFDKLSDVNEKEREKLRQIELDELAQKTKNQEKHDRNIEEIKKEHEKKLQEIDNKKEEYIQRIKEKTPEELANELSKLTGISIYNDVDK